MRVFYKTVSSSPLPLELHEERRGLPGSARMAELAAHDYHVRHSAAHGLSGEHVTWPQVVEIIVDHRHKGHFLVKRTCYGAFWAENVTI